MIKTMRFPKPVRMSKLEDETGQAATEYALLAMWTVIVLIVSLEAVEFALFDFYEDIATLICLPVP